MLRNGIVKLGGLLRVDHKLRLKTKNLLILPLGLCRQLFVFIEESVGGNQDLFLVHSPSFTKGVHDVLIGVQRIDCFFESNVVKSHNTVGDSLCLDNFDPSDLSSAVAMCSAAGFSVDSFDVDNSKLISWNHTTLIKVETELPLSLSFVHERFVDVTALVDDSVGLVLNSSLFLFAEGLVVSDI